MKIGLYEVNVVSDGAFRLDGGAMFGVVPKKLWVKTQQDIDEDNRILLGLNCLLIRGNGEIILVDTGVGDKLTDKEKQIFDVDKRETDLTKSLKNLGINKEDVNKVILTHLHFDHAGGATTYDANNNLVPTFENAKYYIHSGEWFNALNSNVRSKPSYKEENYLPLQNEGLVVFTNSMKTEVADGIFMQVSHGHTEYHCVITITSKGDSAIFWADLIPTTNHLHIPYVAAYDEYPIKTMESKQELLGKALKENWLSFFQHDHFNRYGYIELDDRGKPRLKQKSSLIT